jgi:hypothetical protein
MLPKISRSTTARPEVTALIAVAIFVAPAEQPE